MEVSDQSICDPECITGRDHYLCAGGDALQAMGSHVLHYSTKCFFGGILFGCFVWFPLGYGYAVKVYLPALCPFVSYPVQAFQRAQ